MATRQERAMNGRIGALESWSRTTDRTARTAPATKASPVSVDYWLTKVDPLGEMAPADRLKAADNARRAHMLRLAQKSAKSRAAKKRT